jgi:hypothetical protein
MTGSSDLSVQTIHGLRHTFLHQIFTPFILALLVMIDDFLGVSHVLHFPFMKLP